jgi:hypothetical protein
VRGGYRIWDTSTSAPSRWALLAPWAIGFAVYQLINPGQVSWWRKMWTHVQAWLHFTPQSRMSASVISFVVAALTTLALDAATRGRTVEVPA